MKHIISSNVCLAAAFQNSSIQEKVGEEAINNVYVLKKNGAVRFVRRGHISLLDYLKQLEEDRCLSDKGELNDETMSHSGFLGFFPLCHLCYRM